MGGGEDSSSSSSGGSDSPAPIASPPRAPSPKRTSGSKPPRMSKAPSKGKGSSSRRTEKGGGKIAKSSKNPKASRARLVVSIPVKRSRSGGSGSSKAGGSKAAGGGSSKKKASGGGGGTKRKKGARGRDADEADGASSGDEYATDLLNTYIGQAGGCFALGLRACDVVNQSAWDKLSEDEQDSLRAHLPQSLSKRAQDEAVRRVLAGESIRFGSPRDAVFEDVVSGATHPRVKRWRQRVTLVERRHHMISLKDYQNRLSRRVGAFKACKESSVDALAGLAAVGGNLAKPGGPLLALPGLIHETAEAAAASGLTEWDTARWKRVLDFRNQETERYEHPALAYTYRNPWGSSVVCPLKRGPAIDGGRPREHGLLRNERPSHVTILCIVRDAASRLPDNRGTRADICDLLRDSQYLRDRATFTQLNTVVSGALDRLHYEENAPVKYDADRKEWCYLHNEMKVDDFETPQWAVANEARERGGGGGYSGKAKKKRKLR